MLPATTSLALYRGLKFGCCGDALALSCEHAELRISAEGGGHMRRVLVAAVVSTTLALLLVLPVLAAQLSGGCSMEVRSFDGPAVNGQVTGEMVDEAAVRGPIPEGGVGSQSRPFKIDPEGSIDFAFHTGTQVFQNNHWTIYAQGLPVPILSGFDDNPGDVDEIGIVEVNKTIQKLPFKFVGTVFVSGDLYGNEDTLHCYGEGYVQVLGDPVGTIPWLAAVALILLSGVVLLFATPYSTDGESDRTGGETLRTGPISES
jgi:hypothetical protein